MATQKRSASVKAHSQARGPRDSFCAVIYLSGAFRYASGSFAPMPLTGNCVDIHNNIMRKFLWLAGAALFCVPARAGVVLKNGNEAFRVKSVRAHTVIQGGVASTSLVWTFADSTRQWKPEAEFYFSAPPRGVVTFFAYWFNGERVVAHVVEREKASAIYNQLSRWGVDPALVELDGKNTFHARIFPVAQNQDVRVEMHLVQPLEATGSGQRWTLPLAQKFVAPRRLSKWIPAPQASVPFYDDVQLDVECRDKGTANFPQATFSGGHWKAKLRNLAANRDFSLQWRRPVVPLRADINASRANGGAGYFSLLLCPARTMHNPRLKIAGLQTFDVFPRKMGTLRAGENVLVCGRFRGAGRATISLTDASQTLQTTANFSARTGGGSAAAKLWASRQLAFLGSDERNRAHVIALSKQWNLPSAQTSWLAVPSSEKVNFEATKKNAEAGRLSRQIAGDMILGNKSAVEKNRANLGKMFDPNRWGGTRDSWEHWHLIKSLQAMGDDLGRAIASQELQPDANDPKIAGVRAQLDAVVQQLNLRRRETGRRGPEQWEYFVYGAKQRLINERTQILVPQYFQAVLKEGENSPHALQLKKLLSFFQAHYRTDSGEYNFDLTEVGRQIHLSLHQLAYEELREERQPNPNKSKIASIRADMKRLIAFTDWRDKSDWLKGEQNTVVRDDFVQMLYDYRVEVTKDAPDEHRLAQLRESIAKMVDALPYAKGILGDLNPNRLGAGSSKDSLAAEIDCKIKFFARYGDPLIQVNAPRNARSVVAIFPDGQVKPLEWNGDSHRWEARFDIPTYVSQGAYSVQIIVVGAHGERQGITVRFFVHLSSPSKNASFKFDPHQPQLELSCDAATNRVSAFLASGERIELRQNAAGLWVAPLPANVGGAQNVRFVLTDGAHNRTEIAFDLRRNP